MCICGPSMAELGLEPSCPFLGSVSFSLLPMPLNTLTHSADREIYVIFSLSLLTVLKRTRGDIKEPPKTKEKICMATRNCLRILCKVLVLGEWCFLVCKSFCVLLFFVYTCRRERVSPFTKSCCDNVI